MAIKNLVKVSCDFCPEKTVVEVAPDGTVPPCIGWIILSRDTARGAEKLTVCSTKCLLRAADRFASNPAAPSNLVGIDGKEAS